MRMMPVKTKPTWRRIRVKVLMWELALRMRELHGNPDVWHLASPTPTNGSPWEQTQAYGSGLVQFDAGSVVDVVKLEVRVRIDAVHDHFAVLRTAMSNRRVYSLYAICRSTIEACAFATWVLDPAAEPAERLLRGLLLNKRSLGAHVSSLQTLLEDPYGELDSVDLADATRAKSHTETHLKEIERAIQDIRTAHESTSKPPPERSLRVPSATQRIREMLCDEMEMFHGLDAYHRMSGVAHSESIAIFATWNHDEDKLSIDYFSFLEFLHLAVCSIAFSLERRASCWGQSYKSTGLHKIIRRLEYIIAGEPNVRQMSPA